MNNLILYSEFELIVDDVVGVDKDVDNLPYRIKIEADDKWRTLEGERGGYCQCEMFLNQKASRCHCCGRKVEFYTNDDEIDTYVKQDAKMRAGLQIAPASDLDDTKVIRTSKTPSESASPSLSASASPSLVEGQINPPDFPRVGRCVLIRMEDEPYMFHVKQSCYLSYEKFEEEICGVHESLSSNCTICVHSKKTNVLNRAICDTCMRNRQSGDGVADEYIALTEIQSSRKRDVDYYWPAIIVWEEDRSCKFQNPKSMVSFFGARNLETQVWLDKSGQIKTKTFVRH